MTMVPPQNLSNNLSSSVAQQQQHMIFINGGCGGISVNYTDFIMTTRSFPGNNNNCLLGGGSDLGVINNNNYSNYIMMTNHTATTDEEEHSRTSNEANSTTSNNQDQNQGSNWLQLGLGHGVNNNHDQVLLPNKIMGGGASGGAGLMLDLNLGGGGGGGGGSGGGSGGGLLSSPEFRTPRPVPTEMGWGFGHHHRTTSLFLAGGGPSSSQGGSFLVRPFVAQQPVGVDGPGPGPGPGPSSDLRVIIPPPPRRPHSGIWFMLQASLTQGKEPFLPQVPKSFLRIKDGRMTVRVVMKYVANKLGLDSESEVEIRCRGQQLLPFYTLQHVRDQIWSSRDAVVLLPDSSTSDHLMVLHYGRSS